MISTATHEALSDLMTGRVVVAGRRRLGRSPHRIQPRARPEPGRRRVPGRRARRRRGRALRPRPRPARRGRRRPATTPARSDRSRTSSSSSVSEMTDVAIDADARRVRVGAGTKWEKVGPRLSELGLAGLHGSSPDVGIAGYSLGGGMGWLARKYGLQANSVTAIELVTADGQLRRVDHAERARPVLGAARRQRQLRRRDRDRVRRSTPSPRSTPASCSSRTSAPVRCCARGRRCCRACPTR